MSSANKWVPHDDGKVRKLVCGAIAANGGFCASCLRYNTDSACLTHKDFKQCDMPPEYVNVTMDKAGRSRFTEEFYFDQQTKKWWTIATKCEKCSNGVFPGETKCVDCSRSNKSRAPVASSNKSKISKRTRSSDEEDEKHSVSNEVEDVESEQKEKKHHKPEEPEEPEKPEKLDDNNVEHEESWGVLPKKRNYTEPGITKSTFESILDKYFKDLKDNIDQKINPIIAKVNSLESIVHSSIRPFKGGEGGSITKHVYTTATIVKKLQDDLKGTQDDLNYIINKFRESESNRVQDTNTIMNGITSLQRNLNDRKPSNGQNLVMLPPQFPPQYNSQPVSSNDIGKLANLLSQFK